MRAVSQDGDYATALLEDGSTLRARYLVGADGMHSKVRECAGIAFEGASYEESFVLADVRLTGDLPRDEVILFFSPAGLVVVAPLPEGVHRIVATMDVAAVQPSLGDVQLLLDARGPARSKVEVREIIWSSRFRVHHRVAATYRQGRVLLAGDAAHVHSPAGGQGMNIGIVDGLELAAALERTISGGDKTALEAYEAIRRPVAVGVVAFADRLTTLATMRPALRPLRNVLLRTLGCMPTFKRKLAWRLSGLGNRAGSCSTLAAVPRDCSEHI